MYITVNGVRYIGNRRKQLTAEDEAPWVRKKLEEKASVFSMIEKKPATSQGISN